ncbi:hypothetical protein [Parapedobacter sp. 10938]|uniref:hypothetical protein n=1 Tax=Parapedobacter flavus TaxID=3110225 RepID=UPI002DBD845E|nr:hypothetical protein [Parapedobacter sp. 10938]MEC3878132.1 hypothetical protein [Parapedobacter sp. 10938]
MVIERIEDDRVKITSSAAVDTFGLQRLIDYVNYLEATAKSKATQKAVDQLADGVNASWWSNNKNRFIK